MKKKTSARSTRCEKPRLGFTAYRMCKSAAKIQDLHDSCKIGLFYEEIKDIGQLLGSMWCKEPRSEFGYTNCEELQLWSEIKDTVRKCFPYYDIFEILNFQNDYKYQNFNNLRDCRSINFLKALMFRCWM